MSKHAPPTFAFSLEKSSPGLEPCPSARLRLHSYIEIEGSPSTLGQQQFSQETSLLTIVWPSQGEKAPHFSWQASLGDQAALLALNPSYGLWSLESAALRTRVLLWAYRQNFWQASPPSSPPELEQALLHRQKQVPGQPVHLFLLPALGWQGRQWLDGWMAHLLCLDGKEQLCSLVPPGSPARLQIPASSSLPLASEPAGAWQKAIASHELIAYQHLSVLSALQAARQNQHSQGKIFIASSFSWQEALAAVLFRQAFPDLEMRLHHQQAFKSWPRAWKHLSNCLGLRIKHDLSTEQASPTKLKDALAFIPQPLQEQLAKYVDKPTGLLRNVLA